MRTRTAVVLVGLACLLVAAPFAALAWAFDGAGGLLAFAVPAVVLLALVGGVVRLLGRAGTRR